MNNTPNDIIINNICGQFNCIPDLILEKLSAINYELNFLKNKNNHTQNNEIMINVEMIDNTPHIYSNGKLVKKLSPKKG